LRRIFNVGSINLKSKYDWTVFVYDDERDLLVPWWPAPDPAADVDLLTVQSFQPGKGATGEAWSNRQTIVRTGAAVHNGSHGLTEAQQAHFAGRNTVVATPIYDDDDDLIGVLAGIRDEVDLTYDNTNDRYTLEATASVIGTLLVTLWQSLDATS